MFYKDVDYANREYMLEFLNKHFRYYTMNSWNQSTSYANCVKLHALEIPEHLKDKAYEFLYASCDEYRWDIQDAIANFVITTGYSAGFNGRSDGYIVMYDTERDTNGVLQVYPGRNIDQYEDFEDWEDSSLVERVKLVQEFDKLCDIIRDIFLFYVENTEIRDVEVQRIEIKRVATLNKEIETTFFK